MTSGDGDRVVVDDGRADEAPALSALALRSKAYWGYDAVFLEACRAELTLTPEQATTARVARRGDGPDGDRALGFHLLDEGELAMLFVDPSAIGSGLGALLLADARRRARDRGWTVLRVESDPGAEAFYRRQGARRIGVAPSGSVPGRRLPLLELPVT